MANVIKHRFVSAKTDGPDATQVQPSSWNDGHAFTGGNAGDLLTRDPTDAAYGAKWSPPPAPIQGVWTANPFNASDFTCSPGMIWSVGAPAVVQNRYLLLGKTLFWSVYISWFAGSNAIGGTVGPELRIKLPANLVVAGTAYMMPVAYTAGITGVPINGLIAQAGGTGTYVGIVKVAGGNYAITDIPGIVTTFLIEVT
jgi:hypothetical protein